MKFLLGFYERLGLCLVLCSVAAMALDIKVKPLTLTTFLIFYVISGAIKDSL